MTTSIREHIADERLVALNFRQALEPVEGRDARVHPPTYAPPKEKRAKDDPRSEYVINDWGDGTRFVELDTVQSQANRMEASYGGELADLVPRYAVEAGEHRVDITALPHRLADASIRATALAGAIRAAFNSFDGGDPAPLAGLAPTTLVYGAWDSRDTRVAVPRAISSRIEAHDVVRFARSAQYSAVFNQGELELSNAEWKKGSKAGFAPSPATGRLGGVRVRGEIVQSATIVLHVLRRYRMENGGELLACYLLGLALAGLLTRGRRYDLRSGCALVPAGASRWEAVYEDGERRAVEIAREAVIEELRVLAGEWSEATGVTLGGDPEVHRFDRAAAKKMLAKASRAS